MAGYHVKVGKPKYTPNDPLKRRIERGLYRLLAEPERRHRYTRNGSPKDESRLKDDKSLRDELRQNIIIAMNYLKVRDRKFEKEAPTQPDWGSGLSSRGDGRQINGSNQEDELNGPDDASS